MDMTTIHDSRVETLSERVASTEEIRAHFPALERREGGYPVAYFDGPGGTQVPRAVVKAMSDYLFQHNANTHWAYPTSAETDAVIASARSAMADFLGASEQEIAFGANMTTLNFHLARAIGRGLAAGDEIVVTELDHHANVAPWQAVARERGITLRMAPFRTETGQLDWDELARRLTTRTRVLAINAASNALGTITDVHRATTMAHAVGAQVVVDAVHYAPHQLVDVRAIGCDYLLCSPYKFYGPHLGVLYGKEERLVALDVPKLEPAPNESPERLETGTQNHEGIAGAAAAVDWLASLVPGRERRKRLELAFHALHQRGEELLAAMWNGLQSVPGVRLFGPPPGVPRTPTLTFTVTGLSTEEVARRLVTRGLYLSNGDFYASTIVARYGQEPDGLVRAGCACYSTLSEVERLVEGVRAIARGA